MTNTFPNPLQLCFGAGRIAIYSYEGKSTGRGLVLVDTGEEHEVGSDVPDATVRDYWVPRAGEVYLDFTTKQSAIVLLECLQEVIDELPGDDL